MSFREQLRADLDDVFLNPEEFAEEHELAGETVMAIVDESSELDEEHGVWREARTISLKAAGAPDLVPGAETTLDGGRIYVVGMSDEDGWLVIKAYRYES